jgi:hypothetical protein
MAHSLLNPFYFSTKTWNMRYSILYTTLLALSLFGYLPTIWFVLLGNWCISSPSFFLYWSKPQKYRPHSDLSRWWWRLAQTRQKCFPLQNVILASRMMKRWMEFRLIRNGLLIKEKGILKELTKWFNGIRKQDECRKKISSPKHMESCNGIKTTLWTVYVYALQYKISNI